MKEKLDLELMQTGFQEIESALLRGDLKCAERRTREALRKKLSDKARSAYLALLSSMLLNRRRYADSARAQSQALHLNLRDPLRVITFANNAILQGKGYRKALTYLEPVLNRKQLDPRYKRWALDVAGQLSIKIGKQKKAAQLLNRLKQMKLSRADFDKCNLPTLLKDQ